MTTLNQKSLQCTLVSLDLKFWTGWGFWCQTPFFDRGVSRNLCKRPIWCQKLSKTPFCCLTSKRSTKVLFWSCHQIPCNCCSLFKISLNNYTCFMKMKLVSVIVTCSFIAAVDRECAKSVYQGLNLFKLKLLRSSTWTSMKCTGEFPGGLCITL